MSTDDNAAVRPVDGGFVDGVYNYCDGWCERCRFQLRCRLYRDMQRNQAALRSERSDDLVQALCDDDPEEPAAALPAEFAAILDEANREPTEEERRALEARLDERRRLKGAHPLTRSSRDDADVTRRLLAALRPMVVARGDAIVLAAVDTIGRFADLIAVKTSRAVGGLIDDDEDDDLDPVQNDANGCAKLVRLLVAESREAWHVLMQVGHAAADGVPAHMVQRLDALDAAMARQFPRAMEFVRAGFDEA